MKKIIINEFDTVVDVLNSLAELKMVNIKHEDIKLLRKLHYHVTNEKYEKVFKKGADILDET